MADVRIAGNIIVITSTVTLEQLRHLEKHRSESLKIRNGKDEVIFRVGTGSNALNNNGASFNSATLDDRELALITLQIPSGVTDARRYFAETFGHPHLHLKSIERGLADILSEVEGDINEIMNDVTMADAPANAVTNNETEDE
jgi:hypothetical protein